MDQKMLQKTFESGKPFAIPAHLAEPKIEAIQRLFGRTFHPRVITVSEYGYEIDAYLFPGRIKHQLCRVALFETEGPLSDLKEFDLFEAKTGDRIFPVVIQRADSLDARGIPEVFELDFKEEPDRDIAERKRVLAWTVYEQDLKLFSRVTGYRIIFEPMQILQCEPKQYEANTLQIVLSNPQGEVTMRWVQVLFDQRIREDGDYVDVRNPTKGRGIIVKDPSGQAVAQLINDTIYILFPIFYKFHRFGSRIIFQQTLLSVWNTRRQIKKGALKAPKEIPGVAAFIAEMTPHVMMSKTYWEERLDALEKEIAQARRRLEAKYRQQKEYQATLDYFTRSGEITRALETLKKDFYRIQRHPLTARVYICENGLHIETKLVQIEHNEILHDIGRFVIRFSQYGDLSIWPIETRHVFGAPHPHIRKGGVPCFGTANDAIAKASGQLRFADCYNLICQWIVSYTPETVSTPIEEWDTRRMSTEMEKYLSQLVPPGNSIQVEEEDDDE